MKPKQPQRAAITEAEIVEAIRGAEKLLRHAKLPRTVEHLNTFLAKLPGKLMLKMAVLDRIERDHPNLPPLLASLRPMLLSMSVSVNGSPPKTLGELIDEQKRLSEQRWTLSEWMRSPLVSGMQKEVELAASVRGGGPQGNKRKPETTKKLKARNAEIRREYAHYKLEGINPITLIKKHFPKKDGKPLSTKQIMRIVKTLNSSSRHDPP